MTIGGAFLGGGVELVPAGSCKLVLEINTEDGQNLATTFSVVGGGRSYTATAGADGRAELTVPSGVTYTVTTSATGYDGLTAQTVIGDSATVQYVRFEATLPRVKKSGDTMTGVLTIEPLIGSAPIMIRNPNMVVGTPTNTFEDIRWCPNGDTTEIGLIRCGHQSDGTGYLRFRAFNTDRVGSKDIYLKIDTNRNTQFTAPTPSNKTDNSTQIATTEWVNMASSVVHTEGDEIIAGNKTLTGKVKIEKTLPQIIMYGGGTLSERRDSGLWVGEHHIYHKGANLSSMYLDTNSSNSQMKVRLTSRFLDNDSKSVSLATLTLIARSDGTSYGTINSPPSNATGDEIATAGWTIGKFVKKAGDEMTGNLLVKGDNKAIDVISTQITDQSGMSANTVSNKFRIRSNALNTLSEYGMDTNADRNMAYLRVLRLNGDSLIVKDIAIHILSDGTYFSETASNFIGIDDNSDKILTIKMANKLPSLVHTINDEAIAGQKTFTANPIIRNSGESRLSIIRPINDSSTYVTCGGINMSTSTEKKVEMSYSGTNSRTRFGIFTNLNGNDASIVIENRGANNSYATAPTTPSNATSNEIATADWVLGKLATKQNTVVKQAVTSSVDSSDATKFRLTNVSEGDLVTISVSIDISSAGGPLSGVFIAPSMNDDTEYGLSNHLHTSGNSTYENYLRLYKDSTGYYVKWYGKNINGGGSYRDFTSSSGSITGSLIRF